MEQDTLLEDGEIMLDKIRKHWIVYVEDFFIHSACFVLFMGIVWFLTSWKNIDFIDENIRAYGAMGIIAFLLLIWISFFYFWTKDYFDVWYLTDRHIIAVNQKQMFEREQAFMEVTKIQDVVFEKNGLLGTFLGYGKLKIQTAGSDQQFIIEDVHEVERAAHTIMELRDKNRVQQVQIISQ